MSAIASFYLVADPRLPDLVAAAIPVSAGWFRSPRDTFPEVLRSASRELEPFTAASGWVFNTLDLYLENRHARSTASATRRPVASFRERGDRIGSRFPPKPRHGSSRCSSGSTWTLPTWSLSSRQSTVLMTRRKEPWLCKPLWPSSRHGSSRCRRALPAYSRSDRLKLRDRAPSFSLAPYRRLPGQRRRSGLGRCRIAGTRDSARNSALPHQECY